TGNTPAAWQVDSPGPAACRGHHRTTAAFPTVPLRYRQVPGHVAAATAAPRVTDGYDSSCRSCSSLHFRDLPGGPVPGEFQPKQTVPLLSILIGAVYLGLHCCHHPRGVLLAVQLRNRDVTHLGRGDQLRLHSAVTLVVIGHHEIGVEIGRGHGGPRLDVLLRSTVVESVQRNQGLSRVLQYRIARPGPCESR